MLEDEKSTKEFSVKVNEGSWEIKEFETWKYPADHIFGSPYGIVIVYVRETGFVGKLTEIICIIDGMVYKKIIHCHLGYNNLKEESEKFVKGCAGA